MPVQSRVSPQPLEQLLHEVFSLDSKSSFLIFRFLCHTIRTRVVVLWMLAREKNWKSGACSVRAGGTGSERVDIKGLFELPSKLGLAREMEPAFRPC